MIFQDSSPKSQTLNPEIKIKKNNKKTQSNKKIRRKIKRLRKLKDRQISKKLKNQNLLLKKTLKKIKKGETNQITTAFKKEVYKKKKELTITNLINIQITLQRAQNPYRFITIHKLQLILELKESQKNLKCKEETKISETTSKTI